jgi:hypothetical protein
MPNNDYCPVGWDPAVIREWATWMVRLDAVVPPNASLEAFGRSATLERQSKTFDVEWQDLPELFERVAKLESDSGRVTRARAMSTQVYTVQIFASATDAGAARIIERANEMEIEDDGFFRAGDHPARNPVAHGIDEARMHKVVIGAFVDWRAAVRASRTIARQLGMPTFVRSL